MESFTSQLASFGEWHFTDLMVVAQSIVNLKGVRSGFAKAVNLENDSGCVKELIPQ
jgi:hypothetical protein